MAANPDALRKEQWIERVLGVSVPKPMPSAAPQARPVKASAQVTALAQPASAAVGSGVGRRRANVAIQPAPVDPPAQTFNRDASSKLQVAKRADGKVLFTAPPPPVREITFAGGGGKGAALPGAVKALEESGVLKGVKQVAGASVGSMTAALLASGITSKEFDLAANAQATTDGVVEGTGGGKLGLLMSAMSRKVSGEGGNPLSGDGLETVVRGVLDQTLRSRIEEYMEASRKGGTALDPSVQAVTVAMAKSGQGPTFGDLRKLSAVIPAVKEVVITGTYTTEFESIAKLFGKEVTTNDGAKPVLYVFSADSEPDLHVAKAVHASASFPGVFKPIDLRLASGKTVRFIDGGVMNNTPTGDSLHPERALLEPVPEGRGMAFVFEAPDDAANAALLAGHVKPAQGVAARFQDWLIGADNAAADYAMNRALSDKREEIVVVPLTVPKPAGWVRRNILRKKEDKADYRGLLGGTLNFNISDEHKTALQDNTRKATEDQINREKQDKAREFASDAQMFASIVLADLQTLKDGGYAGADTAYATRSGVDALVLRLRSMKPGDVQLAGVLAQVDSLTAGSVDFEGYAAREMNKHANVRALLAEARQGGIKGGAMDAAYFVSDALDANKEGHRILTVLVYPKLKVQREAGKATDVLQCMEGILRASRSRDDVNDALQMGIAHFRNKSDRKIPKRGHHQFAADLQKCLLA